MPDSLYQLNLNWDRISSSKRTQLLKLMPLIAAGDEQNAKAAITGLKVEKAVQLQLLALLAARIVPTNRAAGEALFEQARDASCNCWLKTDQIRALGFICQKMAQSGLRSTAQALLGQIATIGAGLHESELSNQEDLDSIINCLADLGLNLERAGFRRQSVHYFRSALQWSQGFHEPDPSQNYEARTAAYSRVAQKLAAAGRYRWALRIARLIRSKTFNGLEYCNRESLRAEVIHCVGVQLAHNGKRHRAGRMLDRAARVVIADIHNYDSIRSEKLLRISVSFEEIGFFKRARGLLTKASQIASGTS